jgi:hypothetical protein
MVDLIGSSNAIKKLNSQNYGYWKTCIESYLQGQNIWEFVVGTETDPPSKESSLRKWRIKTGKPMFLLKMIKEDLLEHI